jgi:hypothetical protein
MTRLAALAITLAATSLAACTSTTGTVTVSLTQAPGSTLLAGVQTLELSITNVNQTITASRMASGFDLSLEFDTSSDDAGALIVQGFDANGALIACGQSPAFGLDAIDAVTTIYMAAPNSIGLSPANTGTARSQIAGAAMSFGAVLAGGLDASGAPAADLGIYNAFDHSFSPGENLPEARTGVAITADGSTVYLFGGTGPDMAAKSTLWDFDTTVTPAGGYSVLSDVTENARTGQTMLTVAGVGYPISGTPPLQFDGLTLSARADIASVPALGAGGGNGNAVFMGDTLVQFVNGNYNPLATPGRVNAGIAARADGNVVVLGGGDPLSLDALIIDSTSGDVTTMAGVLHTGRNNPAIATTSRHIVVVGGTDASGAVVPSAEVLDATTFAPIATLPIEPRIGDFAVGLPNDQVLITGGAPASSDIELFTPAPPS